MQPDPMTTSTGETRTPAPVGPRPTAHTFDQINWDNAENETRIGVLQEMVAILLNELEARPAEPLDVEGEG